MPNGIDPELKRLLRQNLELSKENNRLLRKMRRSAILSRIFLLIWWAFIIGLPVYIYFSFLQPYVGGIIETFGGLGGLLENLQNLDNPLPSELQNLFNKGQE